MIKKIEIDGLLSFEKFELELRNLNVLIGPNGSGKSNLIEVLSLLQALPTDIGEPIRRGGGINAWLRKGSPPADCGTIILRARVEQWPLHYLLRIGKSGERYRLAEEILSTDRPQDANNADLFRVKDGAGLAWARVAEMDSTGAVSMGDMMRDITTSNQSVFREVRDAHSFQQVAALSDALASLHLYRDWSFGGHARPRSWQATDQVTDVLVQDSANLALLVQNYFISTATEKSLSDEFKRFYDRFERFSVSIFGNQVILNMHEEGLAEPIAATRWSDGMIRYLCLLVILLHPSPPPLICIDEPELGFHPDIMPDLGRLIKEASERTQVIITTHSKQLVDEFTDDPAAVVVCERDFEGATRMERLDSEKLSEWLEWYTLGELWEKGEIGGDLF